MNPIHTLTPYFFQVNFNVILTSMTMSPKWFFCVVLSCIGRRLAIGRYPIQEALPKRLKGFTVTDINSEPE